MSATRFESVGQNDSFLGHVGGIERRSFEGGIETRLRIGLHHLNPNGTAHGGVLLTLLDVTLGMAVEAFLQCEGDRHPVTIQLNSNMIAAAPAGATVVGEAQVEGSSRTMSWVTGRLVVDGRTLMTGTAVFRNPPPAERTNL